MEPTNAKKEPLFLRVYFCVLTFWYSFAWGINQVKCPVIGDMFCIETTRITESRNRKLLIPIHWIVSEMFTRHMNAAAEN